MVVAIDPADACKPFDPPPSWDNRFDKYIALIARNNCTFEDKVRNAQNAGYDAVIVHNMGSDSLEPMHAKNSTGIRIPSVFISWSKGENLRWHYANWQYFVIINSEVPFNIQTHLILPFAAVLGICFIVMVFFMVSNSLFFLLLCCIRITFVMIRCSIKLVIIYKVWPWG